LNVPSSAHAADTITLLNATFLFIDSLNKISLRSETRTKLKKIREDLDKDIKEDAEKEKKEEVRYVLLSWIVFCLNFFRHRMLRLLLNAKLRRNASLNLVLQNRKR
jgi:Protein of unknown function (DUF1682)